MVTTDFAATCRIGIFFLSFGENIFAGIENSLFNLSLGLIKQGAQVHVYSGYLSGNENQLRQILIYRSSLLPSVLPEGDDTVRQVLSLNRQAIEDEILEFIREREINCLFVCDPLWGIVQYTEVWKKIKQPIILSFHVLNTMDLLTEASRIPYAFYKVVSKSLKQQILNCIPLNSLKVIPNSIDISRFYPDNAPLSSDSNIIFCNARLSPEKGILSLIRCMPQILKYFPKAELWLCNGEYPFGDQRTYSAQVQEVVKTLGISSCVRFLPKLRWDEVPGIIRQSRIVVLPSLRETFGRAALEAMACGKPIVASNVDNLPSLIQNSGLFVEPTDVRALESAILHLLSNESICAQLGHRGIDVAARYSNEYVAELLLQEIERI